MKLYLSILLFFAILLSLPIIYLPVLPALFSHQDPIDPSNITNNFDPKAHLAIFENKIYEIPPLFLATIEKSNILGDTNTSDKRIEVDLTSQKLNAYENGQLVYSFLISSGKWNRTPQGTFKIWTKIRSQKMSGGSKELGTYYYLPNVPYILFFYNDKYAKYVGFSIHGTYWHSNFGVPMSHGCINMKTEEAALIYNWATLDTPITIFGKYEYPISQTTTKSTKSL